MRLWLALFAALLAAAPASAKPKAAAAHPLDPLTQEEISRTVSVIRASRLFASEALFPLVALEEPAKTRGWTGAAGERMALVVVHDRARNETSEARVDVKAGKIVSWRILPSVQPPLLVEDLTAAPEIVRADPLWREAMRKRGIADFNAVRIDVRAPGTLNITTADGPRLVRALSFYKGVSSNFYARPIEGVVAVVDMNARKVVELVDTGSVPLSRDTGAIGAAAQPSLRRAPKPMVVEFPEGPDFEVKGHEVSWQKWRFRFAVHPREGLVLYTVGYEDQGRVRRILYRAAISEMVIPYGDPDPNWAWRNALAVGEYGLGRLASPIEPGVDVPESARLFDAAFADDFGKIYGLRGAAALHERDGGLLWKRFTINPERDDTRRGRELVLTSIATMGNYDYSYSWIFRQDGSLEFETALTGIMLAKGVAGPEHEAVHGHLVSTRIAAPHHQHFFNVRMDFDVDGATNTVYQLDSRSSDPGKENPYGNAIEVEETALTSERDARRMLSLESSRRWVVRSGEARNALGQPTGYLLAPAENAVALQRPESTIRKRAAFIGHHLWVTSYEPDQMYAAGNYPNQSRGGDGLPRWVADDESLVARDVVLWYTFGMTHVPRPEEWPIMPVAKAGFRLLPAGFFSRNPALDLPPRPVGKRKKS